MELNELLQSAIERWPDDERSRMFGVQVRFAGNVICCDHHRTTVENFETALKALCLVFGRSPSIDDEFTQFGGQIDVYILRGEHRKFQSRKKAK